MLNSYYRALGLILCHIFILKIEAVESRFRKTPSNTAAVVGQMIQIQCWTDPGETTHWLFRKHFEGTSSFVYNGNSVSSELAPRFSVDESTERGLHDLTVKNLLKADAGIYECVALNKGTPHLTIPVSATAQLIILESEPHCNSNVSTNSRGINEFDYVTFKCTVNYSEHWTPTMQWSKGERRLSESHVVVERNNMSQNMQHLSSEIIFQVIADDNGILIYCKTMFTETSMKVHYTNATNVPDYLFNWNTTLNVQYGARNVTISPLQAKYRRGDVLNCRADGNPRPSYTWKMLNSQETITDGPLLVLNTPRMDVNQRYTIECIARNEFKRTSLTIDVLISDFKLLYITIAMGIVCAILSVIALVIGRERIKGVLIKLSCVFRRGPTTEPDVLPNGDGNHNGGTTNYELEPTGHNVVPAEPLACGAASNYLDQGLGPEVPVYAEINKTCKSNKLESDNLQPSQTVSVDSKLKKNDYVVSECKADISNDATMNQSTPKVFVGRDGTLYAELKENGDLFQSHTSPGVQFHDPMFNRSTYASIDHTAQPTLPLEKH